MADVTRIHPAPSVPNPLTFNPWAGLTDDEIVEALVGARARVDAAMHTIHSLELEASRRLREPAWAHWCHDDEAYPQRVRCFCSIEGDHEHEAEHARHDRESSGSGAS